MNLDLVGSVPEGQDATIAARIVGSDGSALTFDDVTSWTMRIYDLNSGTPNTAIYERLDRTEPLIGALVNDGYWGVDSIGRNFLYRVERSLFGCVGGRTYLMTWEIQTATQGPVVVSAHITVTSTHRG